MKKLISIILTLMVCCIGYGCIYSIKETEQEHNLLALALNLLGGLLIVSPATLFWEKYFDNKLK